MLNLQFITTLYLGLQDQESWEFASFLNVNTSAAHVI